MTTELAGLIERELGKTEMVDASPTRLRRLKAERIARVVLQSLSPTEATEPLVALKDLTRTLAAGRIIDVMCGGNFDWRSRLEDCDFLESADWLTALAYADAALSSSISNAEPEDSGEVVQADRWQSDRERLEAVASTDDMALAVNLRERLVELGHNDIAGRQALLLDLVVNVFSRHRLAARQSPDSLVEALQKIANPPTKNGFQEMALWMQRVAKAALR